MTKSMITRMPRWCAASSSRRKSWMSPMSSATSVKWATS
jgi:hypothetical protein